MSYGPTIAEAMQEIVMRGEEHAKESALEGLILGIAIGLLLGLGLGVWVARAMWGL